MSSSHMVRSFSNASRHQGHRRAQQQRLVSPSPVLNHHHHQKVVLATYWSKPVSRLGHELVISFGPALQTI